MNGTRLLATYLPSGASSVREFAVTQGTSGHVTRVRYQLEGLESSVIFKRVGTDSFELDAEFAFYEATQRCSELPLPRVFEVDRAARVLVLEDFGDALAKTQCEGCSPAEARTVFEAIASLHAWGTRHQAAGIDSLQMSRAATAWDDGIRAGLWPEPFASFVAAVGPRLGELRRSLSAEPTTLVHGDLHAENVRFTLEGSCVLFDFQFVCFGRPAVDLARFLATSLREEVRREHEDELIRLYVDSRAEAGAPCSLNALRDDIRLAMLWVPIAPLGLHARGLPWPEEPIILHRCIRAIDDWSALGRW